MNIDVVQLQRLLVEVLRDIPDIQLALLQRDELRVGRAEVLEDDAGQLGAAAVVVFVAHEFDELVALGLHELERPGTDVELRRVPCRRVVLHDIFGIYLAEDVRRQDLEVRGGGKVPANIGVLQLEDDREVVRRVDARQLVGHAVVEVLPTLEAADPAARVDVGGLRQDEADRLNHVVGCYRLAVVPSGVLPQRESVHGGIVRHLPLKRQVRVRRIVAVEIEEAAVRQHGRRVAAVAILIGRAEGAVGSPRRPCIEGHRTVVIDHGPFFGRRHGCFRHRLGVGARRSCRHARSQEDACCRRARDSEKVTAGKSVLLHRFAPSVAFGSVK